MKIHQAGVNRKSSNNTVNFSAFRVKKGENVQEIVALVERNVRILMDNSAEGGVVWTYPDYTIVNTLKTDAEKEALNAHIESTAPEIGMFDFINKSREDIVKMVTFTKTKLDEYLAKLHTGSESQVRIAV